MQRRLRKIFIKIGANSHLTPENFFHPFKEFSKATILELAEIVISPAQEEGLILEPLEMEI